MNCAIIGSTKIAEVHAEQLIKNGVNEITFISRSLAKRRKMISCIKKKISKKVIFFHSDINVLKKNKLPTNKSFDLFVTKLLNKILSI